MRAAGDRWRTTARLEGENGTILWSDRIDWLQEEGPAPCADTLQNFSAEIERQVNRESLRRALLKADAERTARDCYLIGKEHHLRSTEADTKTSRDMFDRAIAGDPDFALPYAWQAYAVQRAVTHGWGRPGGQAAREPALRLARRAVHLAPDSPLCLGRLAFVLTLNRRWGEAVSVARAALRTGRPVDVATRVDCATVLSVAGHAEEAVGIIRQGLMLDPYSRPAFWAVLGRVLLMAGRAEEAVAELRWCAARLPDCAPCYLSLVVALTETGQMEEAAHALKELVRLQGDPLERLQTDLLFFLHDRDFERFRTAIVKASSHGRASSSFVRQDEKAV